LWKTAGFAFMILSATSPPTRQENHLEARLLDRSMMKRWARAAPEESVELAVLQGRHGFRGPQLFALEVLVPVDVECLQHVVGLFFRPAIRRPGGDGFPWSSMTVRMPVPSLVAMWKGCS